MRTAGILFIVLGLFWTFLTGLCFNAIGAYGQMGAGVWMVWLFAAWPGLVLAIAGGVLVFLAQREKR